MDLVEFFFGKLLRLEPKSDHEARQQGNRLGNFGVAECPAPRGL